MSFDELLDDLGYTRASFAEKFGYHRNTVQRWTTAPPIVMAYLRLMAGLKRLLE